MKQRVLRERCGVPRKGSEMDTEEKDVKSEEYKDERKKWLNTSDDPEAYALGVSWGLVRVGDDWRLFMILSDQAMREVATCAAKGDEPPLLWARSKISDWEEKRKSAKWDERTIGKRKPGEEGVHGGRPIPMQTFDADKKARDEKHKVTSEA